MDQLRDPDRPTPHGGEEADLLRPYAGQWVAQRGLEVVFAADTPTAVLEWLEHNDRTVDAMFLVPHNEQEASGAALE